MLALSNISAYLGAENAKELQSGHILAIALRTTESIIFAPKREWTNFD